MTPHNEAGAGDYAETVLLPGDPDRARWIAETFLDDARCVNRIRGCLGFTGIFRGRRISIQATGIGRPSISIHVNELISTYRARTFIRIGTCGGLDETIGLRDLYLAQSAIMEGALAEGEDAERPDPALLALARQQAGLLGIRHHVAPLVCSDVFYHPDPVGRFDPARARGILAVDMETSELFSLSGKLGARALSICTVVDNLATGEITALSERQALFSDMARLALETALADG